MTTSDATTTGAGWRPGAAVAVLAGVAYFLAVRIAFGPPVTRAPGAAVAGSVAVAILEEVAFRGALYAQLAPAGPAVAVGLTTIAFAAAQIPAHGLASMPVNLAAGVVLGSQRWATGTWKASAGTHAIANVLALM